MFDSAAHAHRILAILEAGDMMNNIDGYRCSNPDTSFGDANITHSPCANATLRREAFYDLTKDGETKLFCIACASHMIERGWLGYSSEDLQAKEPDAVDSSIYDKASMVRETSFLLGSESSFFLFGEASDFLQEQDADGLSQENFLSIFDIRNDVNTHLEDLREGEGKQFSEEDLRNTAIARESALFLIGGDEEESLEGTEALDLMQLFKEQNSYTLTDMQKREIRLQLKRLKLRKNKS